MKRRSTIRPLFQKISIAEINEVTHPDWPFGARPYFFGSYFWSELIFNHGEKIIKELTDRYGGRLPYIINSPFEEAVKMDYADFFEKTKISLA